MSIADAAGHPQGVKVTAVTAEILRAPFGFGMAQLDRPPALADDYLAKAGALFLGLTLAGLIGDWLRPNGTLLPAQSAMSGLVLAALLAGNVVALGNRFLEEEAADVSGIVTAAKYGAGFGLVLLSAFKLIGLVGLVLVPDYSGSAVEAFTVLGGMGVLLFSIFPLLEWPRRIAELGEPGYYTVVAPLMLGFGLLLRLIGAA